MSVTAEQFLSHIAPRMFSWNWIEDLVQEDPEFYLTLKAAGFNRSPEELFGNINDVLFDRSIEQCLATYFAVSKYVPEADIYALYWYHVLNYLNQRSYNISQHSLAALLSHIHNPERLYPKQWKEYHRNLNGFLANDLNAYTALMAKCSVVRPK